MLTSLTLLGLSLFSAAAQSQPKTAESEIRTARLASNQAIQEHDLKTFASSLDSDFTAIRSNGDLIPSRQNYIDRFAGYFADPKAVRLERIPDRIEISRAAPLAAEHGHWTATHPNGKRAYSGTYMAMWRSTAAGWKIRSELFVVLECSDEPSCAPYRKP